MEQKILDLLGKAGCKPELVKAIGEALVNYKTTTREQYEADYTAKVEQAKKVCIDETESYKRELARRLQIFLETKDAAISAHLERQAALRESEAVTKLKNLKSVLEGVAVEQNGQATNGQAAAAIEKATKQIKQLTEERDNACSLLNKKNAIAEKVLKHNRSLMTENARLKSTLKEDDATVVEGRVANRSVKRIDTTRRAAAPVTSRPTIVESQDRQPVKPRANSQTVANGQGFGVTDIAATMEEDLV